LKGDNELQDNKKDGLNTADYTNCDKFDGGISQDNEEYDKFDYKDKLIDRNMQRDGDRDDVWDQDGDEVDISDRDKKGGHALSNAELSKN